MHYSPTNEFSKLLGHYSCMSHASSKNALVLVNQQYIAIKFCFLQLDTMCKICALAQTAGG